MSVYDGVHVTREIDSAFIFEGVATIGLSLKEARFVLRFRAKLFANFAVRMVVIIPK